MSDPTRLCPRCEQVLPVQLFMTRSGRVYGWCRECFSQYLRDRSYGAIDQKAEKCGICERPFDNIVVRAHVDHDHITGKFRDWLCAGCNKGLGHFDEDPNRMRKAAEYLEIHHMKNDSLVQSIEDKQVNQEDPSTYCPEGLQHIVELVKKRLAENQQ